MSEIVVEEVVDVIFKPIKIVITIDSKDDFDDFYEALVKGMISKQERHPDDFVAKIYDKIRKIK